MLLIVNLQSSLDEQNGTAREDTNLIAQGAPPLRRHFVPDTMRLDDDEVGIELLRLVENGLGAWAVSQLRGPPNRGTYSTPTARLPSNSTLVACALVSTRRFGRSIAGWR